MSDTDIFCERSLTYSLVRLHPLGICALGNGARATLDDPTDGNLPRRDLATLRYLREVGVVEEDRIPLTCKLLELGYHRWGSGATYQAVSIP